MARRCDKAITVALVGNPNVGKSTLFNTLTGLHQHTGNWPGKTVGTAAGEVKRADTVYTLVDLPGTYSLEGRSQEEKVTAQYLARGEYDCIAVVCDGSCLERSLHLAMQILSLYEKVVICVNLIDEARRHGISIHSGRLSRHLGAPVVLTAAGRGEGVEQLLDNLHRVATSATKTLARHWDDIIGSAEAVAAQCQICTQDPTQDTRLKVDRLLVSRRFGIGLMALMLFTIVWLTVWGANYPSQLLQGLFDRGYTFLSRWLMAWPWWLKGVLLDGLYTTCARVISVMLPPMAIFFPLFTLLEDVGYLPRMAFLLDPAMARCGGCGKQALTLCMGLGCNAVGVMGCRIIDSKRERLAAILTNAMIPCNGRFPTLILLGSLFFPQMGAALVVAACVALGAAGAMAVSAALSKTCLRSAPSAFVMELPPLRRPRLGKILVQSLIDRTLFVAGRAITVAAPAGVILWVLANTGVLEDMANFLNPAGLILGLNGCILLAYIFSLPANELLIPVLLMVLTGTGSLAQTESISSGTILMQTMSLQNAVCCMVFSLFHWPCSTTLMTIRRETGSWRKTAAAFALPTAVGCILCLIINLIFQLI